MTVVTPDNGIAPLSNGEKIDKSPWHESALDKPEKSVGVAWKEQLALISAFAESDPTQEDLAEGKVDPHKETGLLIQEVRKMEQDGSLRRAIAHLASKHDARFEKPFDPKIILDVARLCCIMDQSVYMRDIEAERKVFDEMKKHKESIESSRDKKEELSSDTKKAMQELFREMDRITSKINEVAEAMGLKYEPLCNFSSHGTLTKNGPYSGAFYRRPLNGDEGVIVVAFKGTGSMKEWLTDIKFGMVPTDNSPLRGQCHKGFFNGMFTKFASELSADQRVGEIIPFELLKKQLFRLTKAIGSPRPVPVWITGHSLGGAYATNFWQGLLATQPLGKFEKNWIPRDLFTFGSPKVGDEEYARYPWAIKTIQNSWRFVNEGDHITKLPPWNCAHVDREVVISPKRIQLNDNKFDPSEPEGALKDWVSRALVGGHRLESYLTSLKEGGATEVVPNKWQEKPREKTPPLHEGFATWYLDDFHPRKDVESESHLDSKPSLEESVLQGLDRRNVVAESLYAPGGTYRAVVKIQSMFAPTWASRPLWTMGTGWLIREDLVVTAGHNVFSYSYGGQAQRVKCWIGYKGRQFASAEGVQYRQVLNVVTTDTWCSESSIGSSPESKRQYDVALLQVSAPFEGDVNPFGFIDTPTLTGDKTLTVVGYPGDQYITEEGAGKDYGAEMYFHSAKVPINLDTTHGMITYDIDTFGGQSGAPILLSKGGKEVGIGTHCYGAGGQHMLNSGNAIGGDHGIDYKKLMACLDPSEPGNPTPIGTSMVYKPRVPESTPGTEGQLEGAESFWDVFQTVAKIGSVALPAAGGFLGPAGVLLGTVAGGVLGSLAESSIQLESSKTRQASAGVQASCIERAQVAEAALQCVIRLGQTSHSRKVLDKMKEIWDESVPQEIPRLVDFIGPALTEYGFFITADRWEKKVEPNPEGRRLRQDSKLDLGKPESAPVDGDKRVRFVTALLGGETRLLEGIEQEQKAVERLVGIEKEKPLEESFSSWFKPLIENAIFKTKPLATEAAKAAFNAIVKSMFKSSPESFSPGDERRKEFANIIRRALMADCALQAIETMDEEDLKKLNLSPTDAGHEEGIIDSIKTRIQKIGPLALQFAKTTISKYLPVLLEQLTREDGQAKEFAVNAEDLMANNLSSSNSGARTLPNFAPNGTASPSHGLDDNPDVRVKIPKSAIGKHPPNLPEWLLREGNQAEEIDAYLKSIMPATVEYVDDRAFTASKFPPNRTISPIYGVDDNPDAPPVETRPPASPK